MADEVRRIAVTKENLWFLQKHISVFDMLDFFPSDSLGGKTIVESEELPYKVRLLTINTDAGFSFKTDIINGKFTLRQSAQSRPGTGKWMAERNVQPGETICFRKNSDYDYTMYKEMNDTHQIENIESKPSDTIQAKESVFTIIDLADFLENGIVREQTFRKAIELHDWIQYSGKRVLVKACGGIPMPPWVFMLITTKLIPYAQYLGYGEACSATTIYKKFS